MDAWLLQRLAKFFGRSERRSLGPELLEILGGMVSTASGQRVTPETALRSPTTLAAVRCIAEAVGSLPIHLFRRGSNGQRERERDHPAARLLSGRWTPWSGNSSVRTAVQLDALLHGAGYGLVVRAGGQPVEIHRVDPRRVQVDVDDLTAEPTYRVQFDRGGERRVSWQDMLAIATPGSTPDCPISLLREAREAIALELASIEHEGRLFGSGARPSGVLEVPGALSPEAGNKLRASWNAAHSGGANSGRTAILEAGTKFSPLTFKSVDLQFLELRRLAIEQIASVFRVPLVLIGNLDRATWRNVEELNRQFLQMTLLPWLEVWESALEIVLLAEDEDMFVEFETRDLLRADIAARFEAFRKATGGAWLTRNEVRRLDNLPPLDGADELILQAGQGGADGTRSVYESRGLRDVA